MQLAPGSIEISFFSADKEDMGGVVKNNSKNRMKEALLKEFFGFNSASR
jgi:hypothetical protein